MHLNIRLPLLSELEQQSRVFWHNHSHQRLCHSQDKTLDDDEEATHRSQRKSSGPTQHSGSANNHTEPQTKNSMPESHSEGETPTRDLTCCRLASTGPGKHGSETDAHADPSRKKKAEDEPLQPLQVNLTVLGRSNRPRRTCRVLWDTSTEDSSLL